MTKRTKLPTAAELAEHARALARAFNVKLIEDNTLCEQRHEGKAIQLINNKGQIVGRIVSVQVIIDDTTYAVALHELGHCAAALGFVQDASQDFTLLQELSAWEWAKYYSLDWTVAMEQTMQLAMNSYEESARREAALRAQSAVSDARRAENLKSWLRKMKI